MNNLPENIVFLWYVRVLCTHRPTVGGKSNGVAR